MSRYQQVRTSADDDHLSSTTYSNEQHDNSNSTTTSTTDIQRNQQRTDLEDTFGEAFDEDDEDDNTNHDEAQRLLSRPAHSIDDSPSSHRPSQQEHHYPAVLPVRSTNDGVFSNMSAKPESESTKLDETPPAYDIAVADSTPPYWQTTVIAPLGLGDMILVEGLPVGSVLGFAWNLLVSSSFEFIGFMLCYLLHTSHAAKSGSLAGLGVSLIKTGFYIRSRESLVDDTGLSGDENNNNHKDQSLDGGEGASLDADILSYILMIIGWFLIIRSVSDYARAKKMESIIGQEPTPENIV